ncbi:hypothetical protein V529_12930 [Bacillus sp. CN2]|nr:hypothetical protein V529_12930 [Bacillus velezensis SQR9]ANF36276.1 hypothetical protein BCBMB205_13760 [Bacillus velezensis]ARZ57709.1 hypothetical protein BAGQ_1475 [Bacillus velezensis]GFR53830.1 hypothetical protein V529_12930 [Bacillus sp. CN2]
MIGLLSIITDYTLFVNIFLLNNLFFHFVLESLHEYENNTHSGNDINRMRHIQDLKNSHS